MEAPARTWPALAAAVEGELAREFAAYGAWLASDPRAWRFAPAPGAWSVGEVCEHVALANRFLLLLADKIAVRSRARALRGLAPPATPSSLAHLDRVAAGDFRWSHPEHMTPTGAPAPEEIARTLAAQAERALALAREFPAGQGALHGIRISVVPENDRLDLYQLLHFVALHMARHRAQMERCLAALQAET